MRSLLLALMLFATPSIACDVYTSTDDEQRTLTDEGLELVVRDGDGSETTYVTSSAGTGTGIRVAIPLDGGHALEYERGENQFQLGTERFRCESMPEAVATIAQLRYVTEVLMDVNYTCFSGENHDGESVDEATIVTACRETIRLLELLKAGGWCTDQNRVEWFKCE